MHCTIKCAAPRTSLPPAKILNVRRTRSCRVQALFAGRIGAWVPPEQPAVRSALHTAAVLRTPSRASLRTPQPCSRFWAAPASPPRIAPSPRLGQSAPLAVVACRTDSSLCRARQLVLRTRWLIAPLDAIMEVRASTPVQAFSVRCGYHRRSMFISE